MKKPTITAFQEQVYAACQLIPSGMVCSYGTLARLVGCGSSQAVGQALRRNPYAPKVPCHRVIAADRRLHGYRGQRDEEELRLKRQRLENEGVRFERDGRVAASCLWEG